MTPRISVILPYRDAAATLEEAMESVLAEHGTSFELCVIDDGSRDGGPAIAARIAAKDDRVVCAATSGVGIARALAHGVEIARGDLIARMDADDVSIAGRLAAEASLLDRDARVGVVGTRVTVFPEGVIGEGAQRYVAWMNGLVTPEDHDRDRFVESPLCHPSVMMRREALDRAGGYRDVPWPEDYDLWLRIHAKGYRIAKLPEVWLRWRQHPRRATLRDPRYERSRFDALKARYLAPILASRRVAVWGAGKTGKHLARALEGEGVKASMFVDIDPRKIGNVARGMPVVEPADLRRGDQMIVVAVGARGARDLVRAWLDASGFVEGEDYIAAA